MNRLNKFKKRFDMFNDDYRGQVEERLGLIYSSFRELKLDVQLHHSTNVYKQIIKRISKVYSYGVNRQFDNETHAELYEQLRINKLMNQANIYLNAFNDVLVQVAYDVDKGTPKLFLRLPHQTEVDYFNGELNSVQYFIGMIDDAERWAYWDSESHYYIDKRNGENQIAYVDGNEDGVNPFGVLPFIELHNGFRDGAFFDEFTGDDLVNGTIDLSIHLTFLNHIIKSQSFKQLVGKGDNISSLSGQLLDPLSILTLNGQNTEISVLDLQSNYEQLHRVIQDMSNNLAVSYGISPSQFRMQGGVSSGFALQMENLQIDGFTRQQQQDFRYYEQELYSLIKLVMGVYEGEQSGTMQIDFAEPSYPESRAERLANDKQAIDLGLTSADKILKRNNPDLANPELEIAENLKKRNELYSRISAPTSDLGAKLGLE